VRRNVLSLLTVALVPVALAEAVWSQKFSVSFDGYAAGETLQDGSTKGASGGRWVVSDQASAIAAADGERIVLDVASSEITNLAFKVDDPSLAGKSSRVAFTFRVESFAMDPNVTPGDDVAGAVMTTGADEGCPKLLGWSAAGWKELVSDNLTLAANEWIDGFIELKTIGSTRYVSYAVKIGDDYVRLRCPTGEVWMPTIPSANGKEVSEVGYLGIGQVAASSGADRIEEDEVFVWRGGASGGWDDASNWEDAVGTAATRAPGTTGDVVRVAGEVTITNGSERVTVRDLLLDFSDGEMHRFGGVMRGEVSLDVSRPRLGKILEPAVSTFLGIAPEYGYRWLRGSPLKVYEEMPRSLATSYKPVTADLAHWMKLEIVDGAGLISSNDFFFSRLPVVYIDTDDGTDIQVKTNYEGAVLRIQGNDEFKEQYNGRTEIKGRGNSSWGFPKKPYKLKLDKKTNVFGYGKNKHWVLLSNWIDECYQRNVIAGDLADAVDVLRMNMQFVDVIFNGEFRGNYLLGEHIRVDSNRVNVFDWSDTIESEGHVETDLSWMDTEEGDGLDFSGGYIYELSSEYDNESKFTTGYGLRVMIDTPEFAQTSTRMFGTMQKFWADFESAYCSKKGYGTNGQHYAEMADIESMAGYWLVLETMGNNDASYKSRFAYKDRGKKLKFGPVWDFDWGCGSAAVGTWAEGWKVSKIGDQTNTVQGVKVILRPNFYREWLDDPYFCLTAYEIYWNKVRPFMMNEVLGDDGLIATRHNYLAESAAADRVRWADESYFAKQKWTRRWFEEDTKKFTTYLTERMAWLDKQFASVETLMASVKMNTSAAPSEKDSIAAALSVELGFAADSEAVSNVTTVAEYVKFRDFTKAGGLATATAAQRSLAYTSYRLAPILYAPYLFTLSPELEIVEFSAADSDDFYLTVELRDGAAAVAMAKEALRERVRMSDGSVTNWVEVASEDVSAAQGADGRVILTVSPDFGGDAGYLKVQH